MLSQSKLRAEAVPVNIIKLQLEFQFWFSQESVVAPTFKKILSYS